MIAKKLLQLLNMPSASGATDPYYVYRSLILNFDGNFNDSGPNALTVTPYGDAQIVSDATFGTAASFDGAGDYLSNTSNDVFKFGTGDFTVEYWFKVNALPGTYYYHQIAGKSNTSAEMSFGIGSPSPGKVTLSATTSAVGRNGTTNLTVGNWYYATFVRLSGTLYIYLNGVLDATHTNATTDLTPTSFAIGGNYGNSYYFNGLLGPTRISPWAVYTSNFTPSQDLFPVVQQLPVQDPWYNKTSLILNMDGTPTSQIFEDDSPNALAVTAAGDAQIVSDATFGTAASFDGAGDYLSVPDSASFDYGTGDFTVECWVRFASSVSGVNYFIVGQGTSAFTSDAGWILARHSSNKLRFIFSDNGATSYRICDSTSVFLPTVNTWYHIAAVRKSGVVSIYINGVIAGSASLPQTVFNSSRNLTIAADSLGDIPLNGLLGPTRITKGIARDPADFMLSPPSKFPTS